MIPTTRYLLAALAIGVLAALPAAAAHAGGKHKHHPGYVDGSRFVEFADPHGALVEVTLHGRLLNLLTQRAIRRHDETLGQILEGLESMQAVIATIRAKDETGQRAIGRAKETVSTVGRSLVEHGWERFVRVREENGEELLLYARMSSDDEIDGLVVMGVTGGQELLFVNLAGRIDMEAVALLGERFEIPGLDGLPGNDEIKRRHDGRRVSRSR